MSTVFIVMCRIINSPSTLLSEAFHLPTRLKGKTGALPSDGPLIIRRCFTIQNEHCKSTLRRQAEDQSPTAVSFAEIMQQCLTFVQEPPIHLKKISYLRRPIYVRLLIYICNVKRRYYIAKSTKHSCLLTRAYRSAGMMHECTTSKATE